MNELVVVDAGPLVALLADDDAEHERCVEQSRSLRRPFLTTWPILTEAAFLLLYCGKALMQIRDCSGFLRAALSSVSTWMLGLVPRSRRWLFNTQICGPIWRISA